MASRRVYPSVGLVKTATEDHGDKPRGSFATHLGNIFMRTTFSLLALAVMLVSSARAVTIDFVTVGNPGNAPDTRYNANGFGAVDYTYRIGKYEITAGQYTEFLNAVAGEDTFGLYNTAFTVFGLAGPMIQRTGSPGSYSYSVDANSANRPMNVVTFWDVARFANWLHNGQPVGPQDSSTTEDGAYVNIGNQATFARRSNAKYFIPSEDEWYKAAYYDPNQGGPGLGGYWDFATGTNSVPSNDITETITPGNNVNYSIFNVGQAIGGPYFRTEVGEFELSESPYGTFDQNGNVYEWNEAIVNTFYRGIRGASFADDSIDLRAAVRSEANPISRSGNVGFRIASLDSVTPLGGDFDLNGEVNGQDFLLWQRNPAVGDLADWLANYDTNALANTIAIPEPGAFVLFAMGLVTAACRPRL
jgi:formylglycine-generating enzyme required for sulfatase activity